MKLHVPEGAEMGYTCPHDGCGHVMKFVPSEWPSDRENRLVGCEKCGGAIVLSRTGGATRPLHLMEKVGLALLIVTFGPVIWFDDKIHGTVRGWSAWLQEHLGVSKWWLAFVMLVAALVFVAFSSPPILLALLWAGIWYPVPGWLYRKAQANSDDLGEVLNLEDKIMMGKTQGNRIAHTFILMVLMPLHIVGAILVGDPAMLIDPYVWSMVCAFLGFHWIHAEYVPPWKRRALDAFQNPAFAFSRR